MRALLDAEEVNPTRTFGLLVGNNFYPSGVTTSDVRERLFDTFTAIFPSEVFPFPFYVVAGNHDHTGDPLAQVGVSGSIQYDPRWRFPSLAYETTVSAGDGIAAFLMVDSMTLAGEGRFPEKAEDHWKAFDAALAKYSSAKYLFVVSHHPVFSACEHGETTSGGFSTKMRKRLETYRVTAFISGHDLCQGLYLINGVAYVLNGLGGYSVYMTNASELAKISALGSVSWQCAADRPGPMGCSPGITPPSGFVRIRVGQEASVSFYVATAASLPQLAVELDFSPRSPAGNDAVTRLPHVYMTSPPRSSSTWVDRAFMCAVGLLVGVLGVNAIRASWKEEPAAEMRNPAAVGASASRTLPRVQIKSVEK
jgi:hypothetical protein